MRVTLQDIYELSTSRTETEERLKKLCGWIARSRIDSMKKFGGLLKNHWNEILNYFDYRYTNAILEGMNSIIQNIKRRAIGFRNDDYFKIMIYLGCGKLNLKYDANLNILTVMANESYEEFASNLQKEYEEDGIRFKVLEVANFANILVPESTDDSATLCQ